MNQTTRDSEGRQWKRTWLRQSADVMAQFGAEWEGLEEEQEPGERRRGNLPSRPAGRFFWTFPQGWRPDTHTCERTVGD